MSGVDDEFLTVAEVARILRLSEQTVRNWIDQGSVPAIRVGRRVRVRRSDFEALLERSRIGARGGVDGSMAQAFWDGELLPAPVAPPENP